MMPPSHATLQAAAEWFAQMRCGDVSASERAQWQAWLDASAEHRTAWQYVERISQGFAAVQDSPDPVATANGLVKANQRLRQRRRALGSIVTLIGAGLLGRLLWTRSPLGETLLAWQADYRTDTGEQREIALTDGSHVWLNTASAMNVAFDATTRRVSLLSGEVFVATAKDVTRPFYVETGQGRMQALGTRFNVRTQGDRTWLSVFEGAVDVRPREGNASVVIPAGRQVSFTRDTIGATETVDPAREAWTQGLLIARDMTLREVVTELRRYRHWHLGVADDVADLKVYGSFPLSDTDRALTMLATVLPIRVQRLLPWWVSLEPAG